MWQWLVKLTKGRPHGHWPRVSPVHLFLSLSYHIHNAAYCGGSQDHRYPSQEAAQIQDYEGYLILIIALDSIYLNPYDDVTNRSSEGLSQASADDSSVHEVWKRPHMQGVILNKSWHNGVDMDTIVQESHAYLSVDSYPGYVLNPIPFIKGARIQEGSLVFCILSLGFSILGHLLWGHLCLRGSGFLLWHHLSVWFKCKSVLDAATSGQSQIKWSRILQWEQHFSSCSESFTALARCTMNSLGMPSMPSGSLLLMHFSLLALSFSRCATHAEGVTGGWLPLRLHRRKKLVTQGLLVLAMGWLQDGSIASSFSTSHAAQR